jgi:hypothetical protein
MFSNIVNQLHILYEIPSRNNFKIQKTIYRLIKKNVLKKDKALHNYHYIQSF